MKFSDLRRRAHPGFHVGAPSDCKSDSLLDRLFLHPLTERDEKDQRFRSKCEFDFIVTVPGSKDLEQIRKIRDEELRA